MTRGEKREAIEVMLTAYRDVRDQLQVGEPDSTHGNGRAFSMPAIWHQCGYPELERCLFALRAKSPCVYKHLTARYIGAERVTRTVLRRRGEFVLPDNERVVSTLLPEFTDAKKDAQATGWFVRVAVIRWRPWVSERIVGMGLDFLASRFHGEPRVPRLEEERRTRREAA